MRVFRAAVARGARPASLARAAGVELTHLEGVDSFIDAETYWRLWRVAVEHSGDALLPLRVAEEGVGAHNLLRFVCAPSATLGEAVGKAARYLGVVSTLSTWTFRAARGEWVFGIDSNSGSVEENGLSVLFSLAEVVHLGRAYTGVSWVPRTVRLATEKQPAIDSALREYFGTPIIYGCARPEIRIPDEVVGTPLRSADSHSAVFFDELAQNVVRQNVKVAIQVRNMLIEMLPGGSGAVAWLDASASKLGMSTRTLRRHLAAEGTSFQEIADSVRFEFSARHILEGGDASVAASLLGFADASSFYRAFRRWSGTTPKHFLQAAGARPTVARSGEFSAVQLQGFGSPGDDAAAPSRAFRGHEVADSVA